MIDVLVPCRNAPSVLTLALAHLNAYHGGVVRSVTVLDNDSSDPAMKALLERVSGWGGYQVVRYGENVGVWCSLNRGLAATGGDLPVCVITSDVLIGPDTLPALVSEQRRLGGAFVCPDWTVSPTAAEHWRTIVPGEQPEIAWTYNGACWLMDWTTLRDTVGWFDPRFYVCAGDVDYVQRLEDAVESGDERMRPLTLRGLYVTHMDRQTRRVDEDAVGDSMMEVRDLTRLHEKYIERPDVLARHDIPDAATLARMKEDHGWNSADRPSASGDMP